MFLGGEKPRAIRTMVVVVEIRGGNPGKKWRVT